MKIVTTDLNPENVQGYVPAVWENWWLKASGLTNSVNNKLFYGSLLGSGLFL